MFKALLASSLLAITITLTGCSANLKAPEGVTFVIDEKYPDLTVADELLTKGKSTIDDVRKIFGTPTYIAITQKTNRFVYVYCFVPKDIMKGYFSSDLAKAFTTLGLARNSYPNTNKVIYFVFNENTLDDIKYRGYAHVQFHSFDSWYEAFQVLTDDEFKADKVYSKDEIYSMYATKLAKEKGVDVSEITKDEIRKKEPGAPTFKYVSYYNGSLVLGEGLKIVENFPTIQKDDGIMSKLFKKKW